MALASEPMGAKKTSTELKKPLKTIYRILLNLQKNGLVNKIGFPAIYDLTGEGRAFLSEKQKDANNTFSGFIQGVKNENLPFGPLRLHACSVKFPLQGILGCDVSFWDKSKQMRGWTRFFKFLPDKGVKIEASHKSIILHFSAVWVKLRFRDFDSVNFKRLALAAEVHRYLGLRNIDFDLAGGKIIRQHGASSLEGEVKESAPGGLTEELFLRRKAVGVWPAGFEARAWLDSSFGPEIESNDNLYWRKWLLVPEVVDRLGKDLPALNSVLKDYKDSISLYNAQIKKHLDVMNRIGEYFDLLKEKEFEKDVKEK